MNMAANKIRLKSILVLLVILTAIVATIAYGAVSAEGVRNRISSKIRERYKVKNLVIKVVPFQSDYWTQRGRFKSIVVSADRIERKGIAIRNAYTKAFDVTLDIGELYEGGEVETKSRKKTVFSGRIYKNDLNKLLALKEIPIKDLAVDFVDNKLVFVGTYRFGFGHSLRMVGKLKIEEHRKVNFVPTAASVNGIPLPAGPLRTMLNKLNPLIDFQTIPLKPRIDTIEIKDDYILVKG
ncbi:MAG: LmeA family phospholipid-binding protein [Armatimonadetes bacterium]|nr:LmeA family phospholipid-binding protein [Armatimonadota bacterium]